MARVTIQDCGEDDEIFLKGDSSMYPEAYIEFRISVTKNVPTPKPKPIATPNNTRRAVSPSSEVSRGAQEAAQQLSETASENSRAGTTVATSKTDLIRRGSTMTGGPGQMLSLLASSREAS